MDSSTERSINSDGLTPSIPSSKGTCSQTFIRQIYEWCSENLVVQSFFIWVSYEKPSSSYRTLLCSGKAAGEIWNWSLLGVTGLKKVYPRTGGVYSCVISAIRIINSWLFHFAGYNFDIGKRWISLSQNSQQIFLKVMILSFTELG